MEQLVEKNLLRIEEELYGKVMILIEGGYNLEGVLDYEKKDSTTIVFKDKEIVIRNVIELIKEFAKENNLDIKLVKNHLLNIIESKMELNKMYREEYEEARKIILIQDEER